MNGYPWKQRGARKPTEGKHDDQARDERLPKLVFCLGQWFPNWEPRPPREPRFSPRGAANYNNFFTILSFFIIWFQVADVDILQSILNTWSHMLICRAMIMCCVYIREFWHRTACYQVNWYVIKILKTAHPSSVSKSRDNLSRKLKELYQQ